MKVACQACGAKYTIADDKVRGRRVKVRCKGCRAPIVVDGSRPGEPQLSGDTSPGTEDSFAEEMHTDAGVDAWEVNLSDTEQRRMTLEELREGWRSGSVTRDAFVWKEGMDDWKPVLDVPELAKAVQPTGASETPTARLPETGPVQGMTAGARASAPVPRASVPAPRASVPAARASAPASDPKAAAAPVGKATATPLGAAKTAAAKVAGSATATPAPAALPKSSPKAAPADLWGSLEAQSTPDVESADPRMTGARNENSVLFSLDSLKTAATPPPPKAPPPKRPGAAKSGVDDLINLGSGGSPLFGFDNQALLTAPAAPEPVIAPAAVPMASQSGSKLDSSPPKAKAGPNKKLIIGVIAGVVLLVAIVLLLKGGSSDKATAENAAESASAAPVAVTEPPPAKPTEPVKTAAPAPEPAKPEPQASASAAPSEAPAAEKPSSTSPAKPSGDKPAKPAAEEKPAPAAAAAAEFNKGAAVAALGSAAAGAARCKKPGGPTGSGKVVVTFAPSGRVTTANVTGGSFGGTPVGGCVASVFRAARIPPFNGGPVTVSKSFSIN